MSCSLIIHPDGERKEIVLDRDRLTVGKLPGSEIQLNDASVSRRHCRLIKEEGTYRVMDLNSTNGTYVNGVRVSSRRLEDGDKLLLGRLELQFQCREAIPAAAESAGVDISLVVPLAEFTRPDEEEPQAAVEEPGFLQALTHLSKALIVSANVQDSLAKIAELTMKMIKPERILFFSYDRDQDDLALLYQLGHRHEETEPSISRTIALQAIHEKAAILSADTWSDDRFDEAKSVIRFQITSALSVPIWNKDSIYGLIYADTTRFTRTFSKHDMEILTILANFSGMVLEGFRNLETLNRERRLRSRLERYHSPGIVSRLMAGGEDEGSAQLPYRDCDATVLFLDIVAFTPRTEKMDPKTVGDLLNNFFSEMTDIVFRHNGTLDKYIGDGIMAVFGVPFPSSDHVEEALAAALGMLNRSRELNDTIFAADPLQIRIGIHCGRLIAGDFGSPQRLDYTVLGNTVNIASRLESEVADPDEIVVSEEVVQRAGPQFSFSGCVRKKLSGMTKSVSVYRLLGIKEES